MKVLIKNNWGLFLAAYVMLLTLQGCRSEEQKLLLDAESFCQIHLKKNWVDVDSSMPIGEFNDLVIQRTTLVVKTEAFKTLIDELNTVEFYRELYPTAKEKIQTLTGKVWDCPEYEQFYRLQFKKIEGVGGDQKGGGGFKLVITKEGSYLVDGKAIDIDDSEIWDSQVAAKITPDTHFVITMSPETSDEYLSPLFNKLAQLGLQNIQVISEE